MGIPTRIQIISIEEPSVAPKAQTLLQQSLRFGSDNRQEYSYTNAHMCRLIGMALRTVSCRVSLPHRESPSQSTLCPGKLLPTYARVLMEARVSSFMTVAIVEQEDLLIQVSSPLLCGRMFYCIRSTQSALEA